MPSVGTKFSVGLFVIIGMAAVIVFILWLGMAQYFKEGRRYVAYFDESVQGLNKDSPVKYRGVGIGRVESITVAPDGKLIQIILNLDEPLKDSEKMIAQLRSVGITGLVFVELERKKEGELIKQPHLSFEPKYPVIATRPSEIKQLLTDINSIIEKVKKIDINNISNLMVNTLQNANQSIKDAEVKKVSKNLQGVLDESHEVLNSREWGEIRGNIHQASINLNRLINSTENTLITLNQAIEKQNQSLSHILQEIQTTAQDSKTLIQNGNYLIQDSRFHLNNVDGELVKTLKHLETATNNMNQLIQQISDQPSMLFFSEPPPPKPIQ